MFESEETPLSSRQEDENVDESDDGYNETSFTNEDDQIIQREAVRADLRQREEALNELDEKIKNIEKIYNAKNTIPSRERLKFRLANDERRLQYEKSLGKFEYVTTIGGGPLAESTLISRLRVHENYLVSKNPSHRQLKH